jgi:hypothetical protein
LLDPERLDQLIEESRYSMRQLRVGYLGREPFGDFQAAPFDQVIAVDRKKFVQHTSSLS